MLSAQPVCRAEQVPNNSYRNDQSWDSLKEDPLKNIKAYIKRTLSELGQYQQYLGFLNAENVRSFLKETVPQLYAHLKYRRQQNWNALNEHQKENIRSYLKELLSELYKYVKAVWISQEHRLLIK